MQYLDYLWFYLALTQICLIHNELLLSNDNQEKHGAILSRYRADATHRKTNMAGSFAP